MRRFRYEYGDNPVHFVVGVVTLAVGAWALYKAIGLLGTPINFVKWFAGSIVLHDLIFLPIYAGIGVLVTAAVTGGRPSPLRIAALNHLRVPVLLCGLALLVWFPLILRKAPGSFENLAGFANDFYLGRWLALCAVLFAGSAIVFLLRLRSLRSSISKPRSAGGAEPTGGRRAPDRGSAGGAEPTGGRRAPDRGSQ